MNDIFQKGQSGNEKGRPKNTVEQKEDREQFQALLRRATVPALESIISIACDDKSRDRFNACKYIIDKSYGASTAFLVPDEPDEPITIRIVRHQSEKRNDNEWDEDDG